MASRMISLLLPLLFSVSASAQLKIVKGPPVEGLNLTTSPACQVTTKRNVNFSDEACWECLATGSQEPNRAQAAEMLAFSQKMMEETHDLGRKNAKLKEILEVISISAEGRRLVSKILPLLKSGNLKVRSISGAPHVPKHFVAAYDTNSKTIFLDEKQELGEIAFLFFHESTHALDEDFNHFAPILARESKRLIGEEADPLEISDHTLIQNREVVRMSHRLAFAAERKAYAAELRWLKEMTGYFPCYPKYLQPKFIRQVLKEMSPQQLINGYGFNPETIEMMLQEEKARNYPKAR